MAAYGIAYAARNQRLGIAAPLVSIPTFFSMPGGISVSIYGF